MKKESSKGGARPGAGRPTGDKKRLQLWVTEDEAAVLRAKLVELRAEQPEVQPESETEPPKCLKCGGVMIPKISGLSERKYWECTGLNCIYTQPR